MTHSPRARRDILATALDEEVVVYDPERQMAHSLNREALAVWNHCDGNKSVTELQQLASADLAQAIDAGRVWLILRRLEAAHLLVGRVGRSGLVSRREMLGTVGRIGVAALATPVVASTLVPVAAAAASLPRCPHTSSVARRHEDEDDDKDEGCSTLNASCVCKKTTSGVRVCVNPSTALKKTTCRTDSDCRAGYLCIPRGAAAPRCIAPCDVPTCVC